MCSCIFILIINFSQVIVLYSYSPLHHAYHHRYRVCIFSGLRPKIISGIVNLYNELAVHHDCVSFPYYILHTFSWTLGKRIQYSFYFAIYLMTNSLNLNSHSISSDFNNFFNNMRDSYDTCICNGISEMKKF